MCKTRAGSFDPAETIPVRMTGEKIAQSRKILPHRWENFAASRQKKSGVPVAAALDEK
jgi:hypothetical protein